VASNNASREVAHEDTTKLGLLQYDFGAIMAMEAAPVMAPLADHRDTDKLMYA
jgi:hypothetical protein